MPRWTRSAAETPLAATAILLVAVVVVPPFEVVPDRMIGPSAGARLTAQAAPNKATSPARTRSERLRIDLSSCTPACLPGPSGRPRRDGSSRQSDPTRWDEYTLV